MMDIQPITPNDIDTEKVKIMPWEVIHAWNGLLAAKFTAGRARILQDDAIDAVMSATGCTRAHVFSEGWLDIAEIYRANGWKVVYDRPAYNESYEATFTFTPKG